MLELDDKLIQVIAFDGKLSEWPIWEEKFMARARRRGYKEILLGTATVPKDSEKINLTATDGKEKTILKKLNELAYEELILSINMSEGSGKVVFLSIKGCKQPITRMEIPI